MFAVSHVTKRFGGNTALADVSFAMPPGELVAVIGPNGAGKTTLLDAICGLIEINAGTITLDKVDLASCRPPARARHYLERTFQRVKLADSLSARENVMLHVRGQAGSRILAAIALRPGWRAEEERVSTAAGDALAQLDIEPLGVARSGELSFGQRRLVSLGGALVARARVVLLDEPFAGLDPEKTERAVGCLRQLAADGRHVLFVEHNLSVVARMAARVLVLDRGRLIADGPPAEVVGSDRLTGAYLR